MQYSLGYMFGFQLKIDSFDNKIILKKGGFQLPTNIDALNIIPFEKVDINA